MSQLSQVNLWNKDNVKMEVIYNSKYHTKNIFCYVGFARLFQVVKYFPQLNPNFGKEDITFPLSSSSRAIKWRKIILMDFNHVFLLLIQHCAMTSQLI